MLNSITSSLTHRIFPSLPSCMLLHRCLISIALSPLLTDISSDMCRYKFSYAPGYFVDYIEAAKGCPGSKLVTQPNLGLLGSITTTDPVDEGIAVAQKLGDLWTKWASPSTGVPMPSTVYTSPLARCLETTKLVYSRVLAENGGQALHPQVKELLRERLTDHTCDKRSPRSWISQNYPECVLEQGFEEEDALWAADRSETNEEHVARKQRLLEDIFASDDSVFVSLTTHSYAILAILEAVGGPHFRVSEGAIFPLLVRGEKITSKE
ncbi:histidine phosphatase superfamily [Podospora didyma]|uniref:Histidine phosphatase superfamily n=1 Tax=Podospora didyma TaxID=330526 RepID=A0AAE0KEP2_9PEZI|nr:histidine phosphatase superfamily [Podospora didyma]